MLFVLSVSMTALRSTVFGVCVYDCPSIYCLCFPYLCLPSQLLSVLSVSVTALTSTVCDCPYICCLCIPRLWLLSLLLSVFSIHINVFTSSVSIYEYPFFCCLCLRVPSPLSVLLVSLCALTSLSVFSVLIIALNSTVCFFLCLRAPSPPMSALSVSMIALTCSVFTVSVYNCAQLSYQFHCLCFCVFIHHTVCVFGVSIASVWRVCILIALWYKSSPVGIVFWPADLCWLCKRSHGPPHGKHPQSHSDRAISFRARPAYTIR